MKTGFNLLLWTTHVTEAEFPVIEALKTCGYDGVEIPLFEGDVNHFKRIGKILSDLGLGATAVTVMPDEARNCISADPKCRAGGLDHLRWALDCTAALNADLLAGPFHQPLGLFTGSGPTEDELAWGADVHRQAADLAAERGLQLSIEPLNRFECYFLNTVEDAAAYVRRVDRPNFGLLYDTFHANIEEKDPLGCISTAIQQINHVHISENDRGTPGKGHVDWSGTFDALQSSGYDGWLTIEAFGQALPDLAAATRVWRPFFPDREEVYRDGLALMQQGWRTAGKP
ncbi:MAG: sugar phosphate isomerase/epimerase [Pseudomonadota bacterium]